MEKMTTLKATSSHLRAKTLEEESLDRLLITAATAGQVSSGLLSTGQTLLPACHMPILLDPQDWPEPWERSPPPGEAATQVPRAARPMMGALGLHP